MEIAPISVQRQEMEEIDKSASAAAGANQQITAVTTKTVNVHGEEMVVSSQSPYEQATLQVELSGACGQLLPQH